MFRLLTLSQTTDPGLFLGLRAAQYMEHGFIPRNINFAWLRLPQVAFQYSFLYLNIRRPFLWLDWLLRFRSRLLYSCFSSCCSLNDPPVKGLIETEDPHQQIGTWHWLFAYSHCWQIQASSSFLSLIKGPYSPSLLLPFITFLTRLSDPLQQR